MAEHFPKLNKEMNIEFQRAQNTPTRNREVGKFTNLWKLHKLLNIHSVKEEITRKLENIFRLVKMKQITKNLWDAVKTVIIGKFLAANPTLKKKKNLKSVT